MRYALLDLLACQHCNAPLTSFTSRECPSEMPQGLLPEATRVASGPGVGPVPDGIPDTPLGIELRAHAGPPADPKRNFSMEIEEGLLLCAGCGRWYPILGQLPEILPDHLRSADRETALLASLENRLPERLRARLQGSVGGGAPHADEGAHYKQAEMAIASKVDDPGFFGPGYSAPFNLWDPRFSCHLLSLFGIVVRLLEPIKGETVLDTGCGYAWTAEWFHRSGLQTIGVDISRVYLEIAIARMGPSRPHLIVGDTEHLPLRGGSADIVVGFESFHHIPDRRRAFVGFDRILRVDGRVILAEPAADHERADVSVEAMRKYGILERGMDFTDVSAYANGTRLDRIEQVFVSGILAKDAGKTISPAYLEKRRMADGNIFLLRRGGVVDALSAPHEPGTAPWAMTKRRIRVIRRRLGWK